ncbi:AraC family transcriptional regulator [Aquimarina sp. MMG016]|uniref:helix-turn-helix domain-containing protein n=1 Tax=Aquimarina sp. MMG016 TaxID=2822690 RepID=UPI001B3A3F11|nr:AraC family transcriptional regulator [Aquimarina sp. MMG016]MBQ4820397.1 helix-turn-helix transcriptional regulator [Aquimarina sp. MMG016]
MNSIEPFAFVITFLLGGVILLGCFIIMVILKSISLKYSRYFLAVSLFGLVQHLVTYLLFTTQLIKQWPHLFGVGYPLLFLVGTTFYLFIKSYGVPSFKLSKIDYLHFLPFTVMFIYYLPRYFDTTEEKLSIIKYYYDILPESGVSFSNWFMSSLHLLLLLGYSLVSLFLLYKKDRKNGILLKRFSLLLIILSAFEIVLQTGFLLTGASAITSEIILSSLMSVTILLLGYWIVDIKQVLPVLEGKKYKTSPLSKIQSKTIQKEIKTYIETDRPFLNANLKIADVASAINIPSHHISQVLNEEMNTNFYEMINYHRIEKAKEMLCSGALEKLSVQAIGQECGFSSKTSFYRAFKKATLKTPTAYIKEVSNSPQ